MDNVINAPMDMRDRTLEFSRDVIRFIKPLNKDVLLQPMLNQLLRSATSIGANFVEAKNGSSRKDFRNKVFISKKEASETLYWLKLVEEFVPESAGSKHLKDECQQIILILQKIINTLDH